MIREQRRRKKRRKIGLLILLFMLILAGCGFLVVWKVFTVENVVVDGNELYSDQQIQSLILNDEYSWNSLYVYLKYKLMDTGEVPFVDTMEISLDGPHTVCISVYEKGIIGSLYIDAIGQYAYFDKDGFVVETSTEEISDVPKVTGVSCNEVVLYEQLPLEEPDILNNLLGLTQALDKYDLKPQEIRYDSSLEPTLTFYGIQVIMGSEDYISQKIVRLSAIMPQLSGLYGTLHLETWTPDSTDIVFDRDV
jgi:cell division protein FtsQ